MAKSPDRKSSLSAAGLALAATLAGGCHTLLDEPPRRHENPPISPPEAAACLPPEVAIDPRSLDFASGHLSFNVLVANRPRGAICDAMLVARARIVRIVGGIAFEDEFEMPPGTPAFGPGVYRVSGRTPEDTAELLGHRVCVHDMLADDLGDFLPGELSGCTPPVRD